MRRCGSAESGRTPSSYLRERVQARLAAVSAEGSPALKDLHGLGEARQVADDLIVDIAAARRADPVVPPSVAPKLVGAPGTGPTLAKAIARACEIKFVHASAARVAIRRQSGHASACDTPDLRRSAALCAGHPVHRRDRQHRQS
jgi:hypothetical protein